MQQSSALIQVVDLLAGIAAVLDTARPRKSMYGKVCAVLQALCYLQ